MSKLEVKLNSRTKEEETQELTIQEQEEQRYTTLKNKLRMHLEDEIMIKIENANILLEIKEKKLYKFDGFKNFRQFIESYHYAKTQAYSYIKVAELLRDNIIDRKEIETKGIFRIVQENSKKIKKNKNQDSNIFEFSNFKKNLLSEVKLLKKVKDKDDWDRFLEKLNDHYYAYNGIL